MSPSLTQVQKELLEELELQSASRLSVHVWDEKSTVYRLDLEVPSGLGETATLEDHALEFVRAALPLWGVTEQSLDITHVVAADDCSRVIFGVSSGGLSIFNSTLTVTLTPSGIIRSVTGLVGAHSTPALADTITAEEARQIIAAHIGATNVSDVLTPVRVVLDPAFLGDSTGAAQYGWAHVTSDLNVDTAPVPTVVVGAASGIVEVTGDSSTPAGSASAFCDYQDATRWMPRVLPDPLTGTAAVATFYHMGGLLVSGSNEVETAYAAAERDEFLELYGDASPRSHLRNPVVVALPGGKFEVSFQEYHAGYRVDGAYLRMHFSGSRLMRITARYVHAPNPPDAPTITASAARVAADAHIVSLFCGGDSQCPSDVAALATTSELVILSPRIYESVQSSNDALVYKVSYPRGSDVFVNAESGSVAWYTSKDSGAFEHKILVGGRPNACVPETHGDDCVVQSQVGQLAGFNIHGRNGQVVLDGGAHPRTQDLLNWISEIDQFYKDQFGLPGPMFSQDGGVATGDGGELQVYLHSSASVLASTSQITVYDPNSSQTLNQVTLSVVNLSDDMIAEDVLAHEYQHVIGDSMGISLSRHGESRAIYETISDVLAEAVFPGDGGWMLGDTRPSSAPIRNLKYPTTVAGFPGHYSARSSCDPKVIDPGIRPELQSFCGYNWVGITNSALAHIADGIPAGAINGQPASAIPGMGRVPLAHLLRRTAPLLRFSDRFLQFCIALEDNCAVLASEGYTVDGFTFTTASCQLVHHAFDLVGITKKMQHGSTLLFGGTIKGSTVHRAHAGYFLRNGCTMREQAINMINPAGQHLRSTSGELPRMKVWYGEQSDPELQVEVTTSAWLDHSLPTAREVVFVVTAKWAKPSYTVLYEDDFNLGPSLTDPEECLAPLGLVRSLYQSQDEVHETGFFDTSGSAIFHRANGVSISLPGNGSNCIVLERLAFHRHKGTAPLHEPVSNYDHGKHQFTVEVPPGVTETELGVIVNWSHNSTSASFVRPVYRIAEPSPGACVVPNVIQLINAP